MIPMVALFAHHCLQPKTQQWQQGHKQAHDSNGCQQQSQQSHHLLPVLAEQ
jgi:hypothetical protein